MCGGRLLLPNRERLKSDDRRNYDEFRYNLENLKSKQEERAGGKREKIYIRAENHHGMGLDYARVAAFEVGIKPPMPQILPKFGDFWGQLCMRPGHSGRMPPRSRIAFAKTSPAPGPLPARKLSNGWRGIVAWVFAKTSPA